MNTINFSAEQLSNSFAYDAALEAGTCLVRQIFKNPNGKNKYTVQLEQKAIGLNRPVSPNIDEFALEANNLDAIEQKSLKHVMSFAPEKLEQLGLLSEGYINGNDEVIHASKLFPETLKDGGSVNIKLIENTEARYPTQQPKLNPQTNEVLLYNGKPIFVHTMLSKTSGGHQLLAHTETIAKMDYDAGRVPTEGEVAAKAEVF